MQNWSGGYPTDLRYYDTVQLDSSPITMAPALRVSGHLPPAGDGPYRYAELGCGTAFNLIALAAANPQAEFVGYDFLPEHVVRANLLIEEAGLGNATVEEASFADLAAGPAPELFDYIVLHGVWTWVSAENQGHLVTILRRFLRPGGVANIGYSVTAGWAAATPIRQLVKVVPSQGESRYDAARQAIDAWIKLQDAQQADRMWTRLRDLPDDYFAQDFASSNASTMWHSELAEALSDAKLTYACPANLAEQFDPLVVSDEAMAFIARGMKEGWGETARDLAYDRSFRSDMFVRGAPKPSLPEIWRSLRALTITPWSPLLESEEVRNENAPQREFEPELAQKLKTALSRGEQTMGNLADALDLPEAKALQVILMTMVQGEARIVRPHKDVAQAQDSVAGFLAALARYRRDGTEFPGIASPRTAGSVRLNQAERQALFDGDTSDENVVEGLARLELPDF